MGLLIALDYDDTWTADRKLWADFVAHAHSRGHRVYCVTARRYSDENVAEIMSDFRNWGLDQVICGPVFSNLKSKQDKMTARGVKIDIWIDDNPEVIVKGIV